MDANIQLVKGKKRKTNPSNWKKAKIKAAKVKDSRLQPK